MNEVSIKHPEWLYIDVNGKTSYGYDQEWFTDEWQRLSGCGPTSHHKYWAIRYLGMAY